MNRYYRRETWKGKPEPESDFGIMDRQFIEIELAEKAAREVKSNKIALWISIGVGIVGAIATVIPLFK